MIAMDLKAIWEMSAKAVGEFITHWAMVERCIDFCIAIIYQKAGGKHLDNEIPQALWRRVKFLRRCFNQVSVLASFADEGRSLLDRITALTDTRNMLVHGCLSSYTSDSNGQEFLFVRIDLAPDKQMHVSTSLRITGREFVENNSEAFSLTTDLIDFTDRLLQAVVPKHEIHELFRSL